MKHTHSDTKSVALAATLHCLTGCAIGEILGMIIGTVLHLPKLSTILLSVGLAFFFGYLLSILPLLKHGIAPKKALKIVLAADTLSILAMEIVDNAVMALVPGAMDASLVNPIFWATMPIALFAGFLAAYPVNLHLLGKGKGHALVHGSLHHG